MDEGTIIAGRYRLERRAAEVDGASLFDARHIALDESVTLRILADSVRDQRQVTKFVRDARNSARVKSAHVPRFIDVGTLEDGRPFVVMEHLQGEDAASRLARSGPPNEAIDWVVQACEALCAAHAVGIVHRAMTTSSLFLVSLEDGTETVKVMNFGTSRVRDSSGQKEDEGLTAAGLAASEYTAPEALLGRDVDFRADVWSVGVILYELLTGKKPFAGGEPIKNVLLVTPPPPSTIAPNVPAGLDAIVARCLAKRAEERFPSAQELLTELMPYVKRRMPSAPRLLMQEEDAEDGVLHVRTNGGIQEIALDANVSSDNGSRERPPSRTKKRLALAFAMAAAAGVGAAAWLCGTGHVALAVQVTTPETLAVHSEPLPSVAPLPIEPAPMVPGTMQQDPTPETASAKHRARNASSQDRRERLDAHVPGDGDPWGWTR